jgi:beta-1,2-mannobiose phosphorylase / 1,2-beta-oligomannan phosphorylase
LPPPPPPINIRRHPGNPVIKPSDLPEPSQCCFNSGAVRFKGEIVMALNTWDACWYPKFYIARSKDGLSFRIEPKPFVDRTPDEYPYRGQPGGFFDTRITPLEGTHYITHNLASGLGGRIRLLRSDDFTKFEDLGFITGIDHRNCVIFPEKIGGDYVRLERPNGEGSTGGDIYLSRSPDLIHWGRTELVLQKGVRYWESHKLGPGAPPVKTDAGWLVIYHACRQHMNGIMYNMGAMLLDLKNPAKVVGKLRTCLMWPTEPYEMLGNVPQVVFPTAAIPDAGRDELWIYYGAADSYICRATVGLSELVNACLADGPWEPGGL